MYDFTSRPYLSQISRVSFLQRVVLVHSILYYVLDKNVITDKEFDKIAKQLVEETNKLSQSDKFKTDYCYAMFDFDGTTGFDLPNRLTDEDNKRLDRIIKFILKDRSNVK